MAAVTAPAPIRVTIDRLVLHGVAPADAAAVQRALAAALRSAALGATGDRFPNGGDLSDLELNVAGSSDPAELGRSAGAGLGARLFGPGGR